MKKQFIAKLLVLVMLLSMVPATALAANGGDDNDPYGKNSPYGNEIYGAFEDTQVAKLPSSSGVTISKETASADKVEIADGEAAITATVVDGAAKVTLTQGAVKKLARAVEDGVITLTINDEGATKLTVSLPAKALTAVAKATGADLIIESSVATITVSSDMIIANAGTVGAVKITVEADKDPSISVNGKELKDVEGFEVE